MSIKSDTKRRLAGFVVVCLLFFLTAEIQMYRERKLPPIPISRHTLYMPSGKYICYLSRPYRNFLSDLIFIWSIQYYSDYNRRDRFRYLEQMYRIITDLDPRFVHAYLIGAVIMGLESRNLEITLRLLEKGMKENPREWVLPFEAGYYCFKDFNDKKRSLHYFDLARNVPGAPDIVKRWYVYMLQETGDKREAMRFWYQMYQSSNDEQVRSVAWRHVQRLKVEIDENNLKEAVQEFKESRGRNPVLFDDLVRAGILKEIPVDPDGNPYLYDLKTGEVTSSKKNF